MPRNGCHCPLNPCSRQCETIFISPDRFLLWVVGVTSRFHSSTASQNSFSRAHLYNRSRPESCGSCLRRGQARRHLTEDLVVVSGYRPLHMNTSAFYACFLRQPLELTLKKDFQLLRCQDGNGNSSGLAGLDLDPHAVWGFGLLRFRIHAKHPFMERRKWQAKMEAF